MGSFPPGFGSQVVRGEGTRSFPPGFDHKWFAGKEQGRFRLGRITGGTREEDEMGWDRFHLGWVTGGPWANEMEWSGNRFHLD